MLSPLIVEKSSMVSNNSYNQLCHTISKQRGYSSRSCPMNDMSLELTFWIKSLLTLSSSSRQNSALFILEPHRGQLPPLNL
jgi:hypothetical protein